MAISKRTIMKQKIQELKEMGLSKTEIIRHFKEKHETPPSWPTVAKYYDMDGVESSEESPFAKERVFDVEPYRGTVLEILKRNPKGLRISSIYDVLLELYVDTEVVERLPGNEQTLRNYVAWLRETGRAPKAEEKGRIYEIVDEMPPGKQLIVDFGEQEIEGGQTVHLMCMVLRFSRFRFIVVQDHKFNSSEACRGLYLCFKRIGGRVEMLVIDQDSVFIYEEKYGEIIETRIFLDFLKEQELTLFVCRKKDPESKGSVEKTVQYVEQNYFSARVLYSVPEAKTGIASWLNRKNAEVNRATLMIPAEQLEVERPFLRPLVSSLYALVENDFSIYEVKNMPYVRYKTNRYQVPRSCCFTTVKFKVVNDIIHIYDIATGAKIASHQIDERKNITVKDPQFKKESSTAWMAVATSLRTKYWCGSLNHFINGVSRENERYRYEQFQAIERFLDGKRPIDREFLEKVLALCCDRFAYCVSEFQAIYLRMEADARSQEPELFPMQVDTTPRIEVQSRAMESYSKAFLMLADEEGGGRS